MADLLIRAGMIDHLVVSDLLAPGAGPRLASLRPPIAQLVADAHVATAKPVLGELARGAGIPYLVDPDTVLLQSEVAPDDRWVQLPYGRSGAGRPDGIDPERLVEDVVEFQLDKGATTVIPPYLYASSPDDAWFKLSLRLVEQTAAYLDRNEIRLPMLPLLCVQLQSFGPVAAWPTGLDRFTALAKECGSTSVALCLSPSGAGTDGYGKVMNLFEAARHVKESGLRVIAWRQGIYGPALVAAGLDGYECGMGTGEQTNVSRRQSSRKPRANAERGTSGGGSGIFIETLGRSVPRRVGQVLLGNVAMRPKVMCDDEGCCPTVAKTLDSSRHHAIRTRARMLDELAAQPHWRWRLNHVTRHAEAAVTLAAQANSLLASEGVKERIRVRNMDALARVAQHLGEDEPGSKSA